MTDNIRIGNVQIQCLTDATARFPMPLDQLWPTSSPEGWAAVKARYPDVFTADDFWHAHVGSYLLRSGGTTVLVDTGLGSEPIEMLGGAKGSLPGAFAAARIDPGSIDCVVNTHLHFDHVGWNVGEDGKPLFRNARYLCSQADWSFFQLPEVQAYWPPGSFDRPMKPLADAGLLELVEGEHAITSEVTLLPTPGHTPGHMSVLISSAGETALILGDSIVHPAQVTNPDWSVAFDADPAQAQTTRESLLDRIEREGLKVLACHFPSPGLGTIVRIDGKRYWQGSAVA